MKIAVYSIALNEEKHVERWFNSAKDADLILIADTGSTDRTIEIAESLGIELHKVSVNPWRFDVARNASLALVPQDVDLCIQLDLDEMLPKGWRAKVEEAWVAGNVWPIYKHVMSRHPDGSPRHYQNYFKIHPRNGFIWKYPIHEIIVQEGNENLDRKPIDLEVDHIQDLSKSRKSYLSLLEKAVLENPTDWRMNHYLNREYYYEKNWVEVISSAYQALEIEGGWNVERASTYMWASEAAVNLKFSPLSVEFAKKATEEAPEFYEAWHWRAHVAHLRGEWQQCLEDASKISSLKRQEHHLVKPAVWEWWGFDLIALSSYKLNKPDLAVKYGELALRGAPEIERLSTNLNFYREMPS